MELSKCMQSMLLLEHLHLFWPVILFILILEGTLTDFYFSEGGS